MIFNDLVVVVVIDSVLDFSDKLEDWKTKEFSALFRQTNPYSAVDIGNIIFQIHTAL